MRPKGLAEAPAPPAAELAAAPAEVIVVVMVVVPLAAVGAELEPAGAAPAMELSRAGNSGAVLPLRKLCDVVLTFVDCPEMVRAMTNPSLKNEGLSKPKRRFTQQR